MKIIIKTSASLMILISVILCNMISPKAALNTYMVKMRDGINLATDVYLPDDTGSYPVILIRSTYGRMQREHERWTSRGYAFVIQDVRGLGDSEGDFIAFSDSFDGSDTLGWIKAQEWCNGKIGTYGGSALGITQVLLAPSTSNVHAQSIRVAASDFYGTLAYQGGVWRKELVEGWLSLFPSGENTKQLWQENPFMNAFWHSYEVVSKVSQITVPAIHFGGWWDIFQKGTIDNFISRQHFGGEGAKGNQILIMKNSSHGEETSPDYRFDPNREDIKVSEIEYAFFDYWLKGNLKAGLPEASVFYYVIGDDTAKNAPGNEWRSADDWPPFEISETHFYLSSDGLLTNDLSDIKQGKNSFEYDPYNPAPTLGGQNLTIPAGPYDQRPVHKGRTDILYFETDTLLSPIEIAGPVTVILYVSSSVVDTDFTAKLVDIYPDGDEREILLLDGIIRAKYREGFDEPKLLKDNEIVRIEIDLWHTSCIFNTGHKIGLRISGGNYPRFEINPNTGADFPVKGEPMVTAVNTIHMDQTYQSALVLPLRDQKEETSDKTLLEKLVDIFKKIFNWIKNLFV